MWLSITLLGLLPGSPNAPEIPRGLYVEARTATVFAGACHLGAQYTTQGREALLAWRIESGAWDGVDLSGVELAVAVRSDVNLAEGRARRESVIFLEPSLSAERRGAALAWLSAEHAEILGRTLRVKSARIAIERSRDAFRVRVGEGIELRGSDLPERECCTQPYKLWYRPLASIVQPLVGRADVFRFADEDLDRRWRRTFDNCAFLGRFGEAADQVSAARTES